MDSKYDGLLAVVLFGFGVVLFNIALWGIYVAIHFIHKLW
jgi:hypothetical protein